MPQSQGCQATAASLSWGNACLQGRCSTRAAYADTHAAPYATDAAAEAPGAFNPNVVGDVSAQRGVWVHDLGARAAPDPLT